MVDINLVKSLENVVDNDKNILKFRLSCFPGDSEAVGHWFITKFTPLWSFDLISCFPFEKLESGYFIDSKLPEHQRLRGGRE